MSHARQKSGEEINSPPDFLKMNARTAGRKIFCVLRFLLILLETLACSVCDIRLLSEQVKKCMSMAKINYIFDTEARSKPRRGWPPKNCCHCRKFRVNVVLPTPLLLKYLRTLVPSRCLNFGKKTTEKYVELISYKVLTEKNVRGRIIL